MARNQEKVARTRRAGSFNEILIAQGKNRGAHDPAVARNAGNADGNHNVLQAGSKRRNDGNVQQDRRDGKQYVHTPHDDVICRSPIIPRDRAERYTADQGNADGDKAD